jgi:dUTP pyrophosphatase
LQGNEKICVHYKVVSPYFVESYLPKYASKGAGGLDLHACIDESLTIQPGQRIAVPVGIAMEFSGPEVVAFVYARSGLAMRFGIGLPNGVGVIDSDYRGEIKVLLMNFSDVPFEIQPGDRIAQLIFAPVLASSWEKTDELSATSRGSGGFGSTGINESK